MKKIVLFSIVLTLAACHKNEKPAPEDNRQYSYWTVNEDSFKTNHVSSEAYHSPGNAITVLEGGDQENSFDISFKYLLHLPTSGDFTMVDASSTHRYIVNPVGIDFWYQGGYYFLARPTGNHLSASSVNGKARYTLPPTWFYSYYHPEDSVLISGIFNEP